MSFNEMEKAKHLASLSTDPTNHSVPVYDIISLPPKHQLLPHWQYIVVMPLLRQISSPAFHCRNEVLDALHQFLEVVISSLYLLNDGSADRALGPRVYASS